MKANKQKRFILVISAVLILLTVNAAGEPVSGILQKADSLIGTPYRTGGISPGGFDCSGFVSYLYRPTLPDIPRISRDMARKGVPVVYGEWRPGDLLFFATGSDPSRINHVAIWYGEGIIIHSISDGPETGVVETPYEARYWKRRYVSARRVLPEAVSADAPLNGNPEIQEVPESPEPIPPVTVNKEAPSPWDNFDGVLRGDFSSWQQADKDAFEAYKKENG